MAAGLISEDEFLRFTQHFLTLNAKNRDTWELRESIFNKKQVYLYKKVSVVVDKPCTDQGVGPTADEITSLEEEDSSCLESGTDNSTLSPSSDPTGDTKGVAPVHLVYEYHVVYSQSYNVPVLYFNIYKADGSLLNLEEVWSRVPDMYRDRLHLDRWTFLTQQEHPILGRPYFQLHPCHTADLMEQVAGISSPGNNSNYIIAWLSAVGPVVGLDLPLTFAHMTLDEPP
ncbi:ubiquitin-like-conjugating enzyme ATG10 [Argopecten irradians]|uniref:ubiquitin-like-conjugating enzyme ATG10 n=1 Tax=Argopecten irradians TaxID=31199 RepID=UPI0037146258